MPFYLKELTAVWCWFSSQETWFPSWNQNTPELFGFSCSIDSICHSNNHRDIVIMCNKQGKAVTGIILKMHKEDLIFFNKMSHFGLCVCVCVYFLKESVAGVFKGKAAGDVGAPRGHPFQHPSAMQRQPAGQSGRSRLPTGRESSRAASVQRTRAGWQHDAVSR